MCAPQREKLSNFQGKWHTDRFSQCRASTMSSPFSVTCPLTYTHYRPENSGVPTLGRSRGFWLGVYYSFHLLNLQVFKNNIVCNNYGR